MQEVISMFEAVKKGMDDNIWNYTKDGKCSGCGSCCSDILPVSKSEIREIQKYISENHISESKHLFPFAKPAIDMTCPFRDNGKRVCTIYLVRPEICRFFICDNEKRAKYNRELLKVGRKIISMREVFFNNESN